MIEKLFATALLLGASLASATGAAAAAEPADPPNILLIVAGDMGPDASPCHPVSGQRKPVMPVLLRMCREGLVLDNAFANSQAALTHAAMLTGRHGFRTGGGSEGRTGAAPTIFRFLDRHTSNGYAHAVIGGWELPDALPPGPADPRNSGAGYFAGVLAGDAIDPFNWPRSHNGKTEKVAKYITSALTDEAANWINRQRKPWFVWLAHVAQRFPLHLPPKNLHGQFELNGSKADIGARPRDYYFAALEAIDRETGRLLAGMPQSVRDNTLVIFLGGGGTPDQLAQGFGKGRAGGSLYIGGTAAPTVVWGKGVLRRGGRDRSLIGASDVFATVAELAGVDMKAARAPEDSISFAGLLAGRRKLQRRFAFSEALTRGKDMLIASVNGVSGAKTAQGDSKAKAWAIRDRRWTLISGGAGQVSLFDRRRDPFERADLMGGKERLDREATAALLRLKALARRLRAGQAQGSGGK